MLNLLIFERNDGCLAYAHRFAHAIGGHNSGFTLRRFYGDARLRSRLDGGDELILGNVAQDAIGRKDRNCGLGAHRARSFRSGTWPRKLSVESCPLLSGSAGISVSGSGRRLLGFGITAPLKSAGAPCCGLGNRGWGTLLRYQRSGVGGVGAGTGFASAEFSSYCRRTLSTGLMPLRKAFL